AGRDRARATGAVAGMHDIAVALLKLDAFEGDAELRREHLGKRAGVPLTVVERSGDQSYRAVIFKHDLAEFDARRRRDFAVGAHQGGVGQHGLDVYAHQRRAINAGNVLADVERERDRRHSGDVGPEIAVTGNLEGEELAFTV